MKKLTKKIAGESPTVVAILPAKSAEQWNNLKDAQEKRLSDLFTRLDRLERQTNMLY
jgi:hypothetical protein